MPAEPAFRAIRILSDTVIVGDISTAEIQLD